MNKQEKVISLLKTHGRLATNQIAAFIGSPHPRCLILLQEMWESGSIVGEVETNATYWKLKGERSASETPGEHSLSINSEDKK